MKKAKKIVVCLVKDIETKQTKMRESSVLSTRLLPYKMANESNKCIETSGNADSNDEIATFEQRENEIFNEYLPFLLRFRFGFLNNGMVGSHEKEIVLICENKVKIIVNFTF